MQPCGTVVEATAHLDLDFISSGTYLGSARKKVKRVRPRVLIVVGRGNVSWKVMVVAPPAATVTLPMAAARLRCVNGTTEGGLMWIFLSWSHLHTAPNVLPELVSRPWVACETKRQYLEGRSQILGGGCKRT